MFAGSSPPALRDVRTVFIRLWRRILNARGTWLVERCHRRVVRVGFVFVVVRIGLQRAAVEDDSIRKNPHHNPALSKFVPHVFRSARSINSLLVTGYEPVERKVEETIAAVYYRRAGTK
jgi:hypothetical protein